MNHLLYLRLKNVHMSLGMKEILTPEPNPTEHAAPANQ